MNEFWVTHHTGFVVLKVEVYDGIMRDSYGNEVKEFCEILHCPEDFYVTEWADGEIASQINADEFARS